ncbi:MAG: hypothetical protein WC527_07595 [Candidatus Margulisiibacteriota bacterium]
MALKVTAHRFADSYFRVTPEFRGVPRADILQRNEPICGLSVAIKVHPETSMSRWVQKLQNTMTDPNGMNLPLHVSNPDNMHTSFVNTVLIRGAVGESMQYIPSRLLSGQYNPLCLFQILRSASGSLNDGWKEVVPLREQKALFKKFTETLRDEPFYDLFRTPRTLEFDSILVGESGVQLCAKFDSHLDEIQTIVENALRYVDPRFDFPIAHPRPLHTTLFRYAEGFNYPHYLRLNGELYQFAKQNGPFSLEMSLDTLRIGWWRRFAMPWYKMVKLTEE